MDETLKTILAFGDREGKDRPLALHIAVPKNLTAPHSDAISSALAQSGYDWMHHYPCVMSEATKLDVVLALLDPVDIRGAQAGDGSPILWYHDVPYAVRPGNSHNVVVPRAVEALARRLLALDR